jgi:hypothetical protein
MRCEDVFANLTDLLEGQLDPEVEVLALEHLASCTSCETVLAETRTIVELAADVRPVGLSPSVRRSLLDRIVDEVRADP